MVWQDNVIFITILCLTYALVPQVIKGFKEKRGYIALQTSSITATGMYVMAFTYFTLELYFSAFITLVTALLWSTLLCQRIRYKN